MLNKLKSRQLAMDKGNIVAIVFDVKSPILGFENITKFEFEQLDENFASIKNVDSGIPSFTLINPFVLREYSFDIPLAIKALMSLESNTNLLVYNIVVIQTPLQESLVNFIAPVIFNVDNKTMSQVVLDESQNPEFGAIESLSNYMISPE
jgi:flagellar assembly factor FliW